MNEKINQLLNENISTKPDCNLCQEINLEAGQKNNYGAVIVYKVGDSPENSWLATLSPKTGSHPEKDFSIQLMPLAHLTHFSQMGSYPELAKNYGVAFSKISQAMTQIMAQENSDFQTISESRENAVSIAIYGKCTNWKEKKEHLHIKIFPFRGNIGQPYTVDSSFGRKQIHQDPETKEEFIKMTPVRKVLIEKQRFEQLSQQLINLLKNNK